MPSGEGGGLQLSGSEDDASAAAVAAEVPTIERQDFLTSIREFNRTNSRPVAVHVGTRLPPAPAPRPNSLMSQLAAAIALRRNAMLGISSFPEAIVSHFSDLSIQACTNLELLNPDSVFRTVFPPQSEDDVDADGAAVFCFALPLLKGGPRPLTIASCCCSSFVSYFEVEIVSFVQDGDEHDEVDADERRRGVFSLGLVPSMMGIDMRSSNPPGTTPGSVGYQSDTGRVVELADGGRSPTLPFFGAGDTVGCGIDWETEEVFFVLNGKRLSDFVDRKRDHRVSESDRPRETIPEDRRRPLTPWRDFSDDWSDGDDLFGPPSASPRGNGLGVEDLFGGGLDREESVGDDLFGSDPESEGPESAGNVDLFGGDLDFDLFGDPTVGDESEGEERCNDGVAGEEESDELESESDRSRRIKRIRRRLVDLDDLFGSSSEKESDAFDESDWSATDDGTVGNGLAEEVSGIDDVFGYSSSEDEDAARYPPSFVYRLFVAKIALMTSRRHACVFRLNFDGKRKAFVYQAANTGPTGSLMSFLKSGALTDCVVVCVSD